MTQWFVYLVRCSDGTLYCGISTDVDRRVKEHNTSKRGARYTHKRRPVVLVYKEVVGEQMGMALKRERQIKNMSKKAKELLILSSSI